MLDLRLSGEQVGSVKGSRAGGPRQRGGRRTKVRSASKGAGAGRSGRLGGSAGRARTVWPGRGNGADQPGRPSGSATGRGVGRAGEGRWAGNGVPQATSGPESSTTRGGRSGPPHPKDLSPRPVPGATGFRGRSTSTRPVTGCATSPPEVSPPHTHPPRLCPPCPGKAEATAVGEAGGCTAQSVVIAVVTFSKGPPPWLARPGGRTAEVTFMGGMCPARGHDGGGCAGRGDILGGDVAQRTNASRRPRGREKGDLARPAPGAGSSRRPPRPGTAGQGVPLRLPCLTPRSSRCSGPRRGDHGSAPHGTARVPGV